ncbi:endogenous retrovirus group K member 10 Gag polyprotein-like [Carettochelys insculpta]|uniref:endogenous retrovirus group K member 10 Gag polyprotein-like n=1 Tax=Carettochelys insculpta TaxID=44489 RepID=UPI003EBFB4A1
MGNSPSSYSSYIELLQTLLKSSGVKVKQSTFQKLFDLICKHCYWLTPSGKNALDLKQWRLIMRALRRAHQKGEIIPLPVWSLCNLVARALEPLQSGSEEGCSLPPDSLAERGARRRVPKGDEALSEESGDSSEEGQEGQPITGDEKTGNSEQQKNYTARETSSGFFPANVCVAQPEPDFPPSTPSPLPPPTKEEGPSAPPFSCYGKDELFAEPPRQTVTEPVTNLMRTVLAVGAHEGFDLSPLTLSAFPVTIQQVPPNQQFPQGAINYHHEPLTFKLLKDLKQACVQYGVNSPYTFGLVQGLSQAERLIPWDWEVLGRTVLNGAEFLQFKTWWHDEAALTARRNASQNPPVAITLEQLTGWDPHSITVPLTSNQVNQSFENNMQWQISLSNYVGEIGNHYPHAKLFAFLKRTPFILSTIVRHQPLVNAATFFTDASGPGKAGYTGPITKVWQTPYNSVQKAELAAVMQLLIDYLHPVNIVTDSQYVEFTVQQIETATIFTLF